MLDKHQVMTASVFSAAKSETPDSLGPILLILSEKWRSFLRLQYKSILFIKVLEKNGRALQEKYLNDVDAKAFFILGEEEWAALPPTS